MKRWIAWAVAIGFAFPMSSNTASAQEVFTETSPSDLPVRSVSTRIQGVPTDNLTEADLYVHPPHCSCCVDNSPVSRFRQSLYQGSSVSGGFLGDGGSNALQQTHYELSTRFAIPISGMENVVLISPSFREDLFDAPTGVDIPDNLYVAGVNFTWLKTLSPRWNMTTMVTPSIRSDFETGEDAFRIFGLGMLTYKYIPNYLDASFGVVYLGRDDIPLLPILGFTWTPTPLWRVDANFPRPRIAYQTAKCGCESESWIYTGVALGGNTWAVDRANGTNDVLTVRDYQWVFGWEHLRSGGRGLFVETGAAFGRAIEFESTGQEIEFDDALFLRGGITF